MSYEMAKFKNVIKWVMDHSPEEIIKSMEATLPGEKFDADSIRNDRTATANRIHILYCTKLLQSGKLSSEEVAADRAVNELPMFSIPEVVEGKKKKKEGISEAPSKHEPIAEPVELIAIKGIDVSHCVREHDDPEKLIALAEDISSHGLIHPIVVKKEGSGYSLIAGKRRYDAHVRLGFSMIPAKIIDVDASRALDMQGSENYHRAAFTAFELLKYVKEQLALGKKHNSIAAGIGMAPSNFVNVVKVITSLASDIETKLKASHPEMALDALIGLSDVSPEEQRLIMSELISAEKVTKKDIMARTAAKKEKPKLEKDVENDVPVRVEEESDLAFVMVLKEAVASIKNWKRPITDEMTQLLNSLNTEALNLLNANL